MPGRVAETAKMVAELDLKTQKFTKGVGTAVGSLGKLSGAVAKSRAVSVGIGVGLERAAEVGIRAIGDFVGAGLQSLADLETATTSVDGAIASVGLTGKVTSAQVATWANEIEANIGAAFDDKEITASAATLLRYGKVTADNLHPALVVMTDLAAKTGSVDSAASLLAKALADPAKAAGKLARQGIVLTKAQQDQIKAFVKAGKAAEAQKVILDALSATTAGAAKASQGPYARSLSVLKDVTEDAQRALAIGFLPVIEKVRDLLSTELAKPETLANIRNFGSALSSGLTQLIDFARALPWGAIGASLKIAGEGAKTILDAFLGLPSWVQTAVITGWGLNKITGGAVSGVIGGLAESIGKTLLQRLGLMTIAAGTVIVNGPVTGLPGAGAIPEAVGGAAATGAGITAAALAALVLVPAVIAATGIIVTNQLDPQHIGPTTGKSQTASSRGIPDWNNKALNELIEIRQGVDGLPGKLADDIVGGDFFKQLFPGKAQDDAAFAATLRDIPVALDGNMAAIDDNGIKIDAVTQGILGNLVPSVDIGAHNTSIAATQAGQASARQTFASGLGIEGAIRDSQQVTNVKVEISATDVTRVNVTSDRGGDRSGSRDGDGGGGPGQ